MLYVDSGLMKFIQAIMLNYLRRIIQTILKSSREFKMKKYKF